MCRSGHTLSQCLGVATLQQECAADPIYGFTACNNQHRTAKQQNRNVRRFARRRRTLAAFTAIMGRLGRSTPSANNRRLFKVHYRKLDEDHSPVKQPRRDDKNSCKGRQLKISNNALPDYMTSCCRCGHTQKLKAEELNAIVGNAFRMAYVAQLQRHQSAAKIIQDVISSPKSGTTTISTSNKSLIESDAVNNNHQITSCRWQLDCKHNSASSASNSSDDCSTGTNTSGEMNVQLGSASPTLRLSSVKPTSIPGLRPSHNFGSVLSQLQNGVGCSSNDDNVTGKSQQSTPSSDESNSPTELNSYKRLGDKPPLIKRLTMGFTGRDVLGTNSEEDSCPLVVSGGSTPNSPTTQRPHSGGYINEAIIESDNLRPQGHYGKIPPGVDPKSLTFENGRSVLGAESDYKKRSSHLSSSSGSGAFMTPSPPPLPERYDSLNARAEENELKKAPWFQAGIPREITLEVLSQEPEGAFMVRESTSKPGCYALSLRVPRDFQPSGIAHYLIMRTQKGYKIKGFTKEFTTLTSLITHHSVMPELLPCPLSLSRYNPSYAKSKDAFEDEVDSDPDYSTLADFRKMMADLNV